MLHLTQMFEPEVEQMVLATRQGMAHWAMGGPEGAKCADCQHLDLEKGSRLAAARCLEYTRLTHRKGKNVPKWTPACKYFVAK